MNVRSRLARMCVDHIGSPMRLPSQDLVKQIGVYQRYWIVRAKGSCGWIELAKMYFVN